MDDHHCRSRTPDKSLGIVDGRDSEGVGDWLFARPLSGAWACRSSQSIRPRRSARPCGCGFRAPLCRSTRFTWSSWATTCSPKSGNASRSRSMAGGDAPSTRSGPTGGCSCGPGRHQKDRPGIHQRPELQNAYPVAQCRQNSGMNIHHGRTFTTNREEPF
jgi:hypothetical protein